MFGLLAVLLTVSSGCAEPSPPQVIDDNTSIKDTSSVEKTSSTAGSTSLLGSTSSPVVPAVSSSTAEITVPAGLRADVQAYFSLYRGELLKSPELDLQFLKSLSVPGGQIERSTVSDVEYLKSNNLNMRQAAVDPIEVTKIGRIKMLSLTRANVVVCLANNRVTFTRDASGVETIVDDSLASRIRDDSYVLVDGHWKPEEQVSEVKKYPGRNVCDTFVGS
jgi:hypothetical protein